MNEIYINILNASKILFTEYGYKKVSMDEIAKEAHVTKKTVYTYFKDKEALLLTLVEGELSSIKNIIDCNFNEDTKDYFMSFNDTILKILKYRKESQFLIRLYKDKDYFDIKNLNNSFKKIDESIMSFIKSKLEIIKNSNKIKNLNIDLDLCSFVIYKIYFDVLFEYDKDINEEEITKVLTSILKNGLFNK